MSSSYGQTHTDILFCRCKLCGWLDYGGVSNWYHSSSEQGSHRVILQIKNLALKLPPRVSNTPPIASVLTILLAFVILYATLVLPSRWSMDKMPCLFLAITFWLSIRISCLPVNSNVGITFPVIIALGKTKKRSLSSLCTWMVMRILLKLWPRAAHITPGSPSWRLFYYGVICTLSQSKFL